MGGSLASEYSGYLYESYFDEIEKVLRKIRKTQQENILKAAELVSECIKNDGLIRAFGTGHSHILAEEIFFRAGTLAPVSAILEPSLMVHREAMKSSAMERLEGLGKIIVDYVNPGPQDLFIIISNSGRNPVPIEVAMETKKRGNKVIVVTSKTYSKSAPSRHSSGKRLMDVADVVLDNCGEIGDVAVKIPELAQGLGPTSTIASAYLLHAVMVQATSNLSKIMKEPPIFWSANLPGGMEKNRKMIDKYWGKIRNW